MNLVYVHLNTPIPKHLQLNLERSTTLFPDHNVYLITNVIQKSLKKLNVNIFFCQENHDWILLNDLLQHDKEFRNNFWFTSLARFLALAEFSLEIKEAVLHVESDVIISEDFPFHQLSSSSALIQFPIVSDSLAIASCLYIADSQTANYLALKTLSEASVNYKTTDMHVLRAASTDPISGFGILPTAPTRSYSETPINDKFLGENTKALRYYNGVFDGFNIGRYLFGDDPRNKRGFSVLRESDFINYLDVRRLKIAMNGDREFPYIYDYETNNYLPVFALHIHSKKLALFSTTQSRKHIKQSVRNYELPPKTTFSISIFLKSVKNAIPRRISQLRLLKEFTK